MKSTGIVRKLDSVGRLVLPIELRKTLDIENNEPVEILTDGDTIVLKKFERTCVFCDNAEDLIAFKGKNICHECLEKINKLED